MDKKEFAKVAFDENIEAFMVHITFFSLRKPIILIHPAREIQIALLLTKKVKILTKYSDFFNVFSEEKASVLLEITNLNQYAIELQED